MPNVSGESGKHALQVDCEQSQSDSKRTHAEAATREYDQRYKIISEMISDYVFCMRVEKDGRVEIDFVSDNFVDITGRTLEEIRSADSWWRIFHPDDVPKMAALLKQLITVGQPRDVECRTLLKDRRQRWVHIFVRPEWDVAHRQVTRIVGAVKDITARKEVETALRISEAKYRSIFENIVEGIFQTTPGGRFLNVNPALARMLKYDSPEDLIHNVRNIGQDLYADMHQRDEFSRLLAQHNVIQDFEMQLRCRDGSLIWVSSNARAVSNDQGEILYYEGTLQDITARREAEEALSGSEARFRNLVEHSPHGIALCSAADDGIIFANQALARTFGVPDQESCIGRSVYDFIHPDSIPVIRERLWEMRLSGERVLIEAANVACEDGLETAVEIFASPLFFNGEPIAQLIFRDINKQRLLSLQLQQYADIVTNMQLGLFVYHLENLNDDRSLRMVRVNPASIRIIGLGEDTMLLGKRIDELFPGLRAHNIPHLYAEVVRTGKPFAIDQFLFAQPGLSPAAYYNFKAFPLPNECVGVLFENVTERLHAEEKLRNRLHFESLIADLSARFINLPPEAVDAQIYQGMQDMVRFFGADRGTLYEFEAGTHRIRTAYTSTPEAFPGPPLLPPEEMANLIAFTNEKRVQMASRLDDLPEELDVEKQKLLESGVKSLFGVSVTVEGHRMGVLGFSMLSQERKWPEEYVQWAQLMGEVFVNALVRRRAEENRHDLLETIQAQAQRVQQIMDIVPEGVVLLEACDARYCVALANPEGKEVLKFLANVSVGNVLEHLGGFPIRDLLAAPPRGLWHTLHAGDRFYEALAHPLEAETENAGWVLVIRDVTRIHEIENQAQQQNCAEGGHE